MFTGGADGVIIAYDNAKLNEKYRLELKKITQLPTNCGFLNFQFTNSNFQKNPYINFFGKRIYNF